MKKLILIIAVSTFIQMNLFANENLTFETKNNVILHQPITPDINEEEIPNFVKEKQIQITQLIKPEKEDDVPTHIKILMSKIKS